MGFCVSNIRLCKNYRDDCTGEEGSLCNWLRGTKFAAYAAKGRKVQRNTVIVNSLSTFSELLSRFVGYFAE